MTIPLEGQMRYQSTEAGSPVMIARAGTPTGLLPYSRLKRYSGNAYALTPLRLLRVHRDDFAEMLREIPQLAPRLVAVLSDRVRESTRMLEQREKLKALGKLAAGLAHELNNPASAAQRSSEDLRQWVGLLRDSNQALATAGFTVTQFHCLLEVERAMIYSAMHPPSMESMERSDREEALATWLRACNLERGWEFAPIFVEAGVGKEKLTEVTDCFTEEARDAAIARLAMADLAYRLVHQRATFAHQIGEFDVALPRHGADVERAVSFADMAQALDPVEVDHLIRQHVTHVVVETRLRTDEGKDCDGGQQEGPFVEPIRRTRRSKAPEHSRKH